MSGNERTTDAEEIQRLRLRLSAAEAVCRSLTLEPVVKLTGKRRDAYDAWKDICNEW